MDRVSKKINNDLRVITVSNSSSEPITTVFFKFIPVVKFNAHSTPERRVAAVALVEQGICDQQTAGTICDFHRNTVSKLKSIKASFGITAIISDNRGLKQPLKYTGKVRATIEQILTAHPTWKDYQVANQASTELNEDISRSAVARIRISQQATDSEAIIYSQDRMKQLIQIAKTVDEDNNGDRQLTLNLENDAHFKQKTVEFEQNESPHSPVKSEQDLIERLQTGERTPFAGGFMHHLLLQEINYDTLMSCLPAIKGNTYQYQDMLSTLYFSIANDVKSIESLKLINSSCLGTLIGKSRSPDKDVIRNHLSSLSEANFSGELIDHFAKILLDQHPVLL